MIAQNKWINGSVQTNSSIGDIADVDITTTSSDQIYVFKWNGSAFVTADDVDTQIALASASIDDLGDVAHLVLTHPGNGQVLAWNARAAQT